MSSPAGAERPVNGRLVGLLAVLALLVVPGVWFYPRWRLDGIAGTTWSVRAPASHYASGYSHWRFLAVKVGMTKDEVRARLGPPLREERVAGREVWRYARGVHLRNVVFSPEGTVEARKSLVDVD